ncbi:anthocyanidin 3-O-glucosyltransferase 2-like [Coffea arabica]|uniref:Glycosyltransferase n=1 Tax=Coffea arabica TaxID=13443 RepID=A0A6P6V9M3_COFAR|nr:anthocyanidin 3-O-glucosyltransferase 2-like [Coffea arabica]
MEKAELIFIPWPLMGHLAQLVELAKLLISRDERFSITVLISRLPDSLDPVTNKLISSLVDSCTTEALQFYQLPPTNPTPEWSSLTRGYFIQKQLDSQKPHVKDFIQQRKTDQSSSSRLIGVVVDMFSTSMIDVADEFGIPSYVFFTSGAAFLRIMLHFQTLEDDYNQDVSEFSKSETAVSFPGFANPIPPSVLPMALVEKQLWSRRFLPCARGYRKAKGILINTFTELEPYALNSLNLLESSPQIYPVGPILNQVQYVSRDVQSGILKWLDEQPPKSVVYISFGSLGSLPMDQVKELANGLERSGYRFLWCLRRPPPKNTIVDFPSEYGNYEDVLPEGFLDRTANVGKIVGWVPQLAVLSHAAVGGFVTHCGWNSTLESIWFGVPLATWPLEGEQQLNAFQLVIDLKQSVGITLDYSSRNQNQPLVTAEEIERGIRKVMESDSEVRKNVKEMSDKSRESIKLGGSSHGSLGKLISTMLHDSC